MFFRSKNKTSKKPQKRTYSNRFGPVYIDDRTKTISFREKKWRFEISRSQMARWFGKGAYRSGIAGVLIVSVLGVSLSLPSEAQVARFYAGSCLGGWQNPALAEGEPSVLLEQEGWFNSTNSAINKGAENDIFCGSFAGNVPKDTQVSSAELSFSLYVGEAQTDADGITRALNAPENNSQDPVTDQTGGTEGGETAASSGSSTVGNSNASTTGSTATTSTSSPDSFSDTASSSQESSSSTDNSITIEGDNFESQAGAILDAESDNVSFTLTEEEVQQQEQVTVVSTSGDFATSAADILDAPEGSEITITDSIPQEEQATINGNLTDNFYDILDSPDGTSVQMTFPEEDTATSNEPAAVEPVQEEQSTESTNANTEQDTSTDTTNENDKSDTSAEPTALIDTMLKKLLGKTRLAYATTSDSQQEVATSSEEDTTSQDQNDSSEETQEVASEGTDAENSTATTSDDASGSSGSSQEQQDNVAQEQDVATGTDMQTTASSSEQATTSQDVASSSDQQLQENVPDNRSAEETYSPDHVLTVEYTFNGVDWMPVGEVTLSNWQDVSFKLPIVDWSQVDDVQVRLTRNNVIEKMPIVMLDAVSLEVSYEDEEKSKPELVERGNKKGFKPGDDLIFNFKYRQAKKSALEGLAGQAASAIGIHSNYDKDFLVPRATLISMNGKRINVDSTIVLGDNDEWQVIVTPDARSMHPGKYIIEVEVEDNGETVIQQQEFYWGVLTINTNKSIYEKQERAYLQMGVLDDMGHTICDADLRLTIENPAGSIATLATASGTIAYSGVCSGDTYVEEPDYSAYYTTGDIGEYTMTLTNLTNGYEIEDSFEVRGYVPFVVEREGPTRIYPPAQYEMSINITARQDFRGDIYEYTPDTFELLSIKETVLATSSTTSVPYIEYKGVNKLPEEETQRLFWTLRIKKDESVNLTYVFDAPDVSPEIFLLGPMEFYE